MNIKYIVKLAGTLAALSISTVAFVCGGSSVKADEVTTITLNGASMLDDGEFVLSSANLNALIAENGYQVSNEAPRFYTTENCEFDSNELDIRCWVNIIDIDSENGNEWFNPIPITGYEIVDTVYLSKEQYDAYETEFRQNGFFMYNEKRCYMEFAGDAEEDSIVLRHKAEGVSVVPSKTVNIRIHNFAVQFNGENILVDAILPLTINCNHSWDGGTVTTAASYKQKQVTTYTCTKCGDSSKTVVGQYLTLNKPVISKVENLSKNTKVTWKKVTGAEGYYVYCNSKLIATISKGSTVTYTDTKATANGTKYQYKVVAFAAGGDNKSAVSEVVTKYFVSPIAAPALTNVANGISVKWTQNSTATGYYVYKSINGGEFKRVKTITSKSTVTWTDTSATGNRTKYAYRIVSYKTVSGTNYVSANGNTKETYFLSVSKISSAKNSGSKKITLKWAKNSKASGYEIQYSDGKKTYKTTINKNSTVSKDYTKLTKNATYKFWVRSYYKDKNGKMIYSAWSDAVSCVVKK